MSIDIRLYCHYRKAENSDKVGAVYHIPTELRASEKPDTRVARYSVVVIWYLHDLNGWLQRPSQPTARLAQQLVLSKSWHQGGTIRVLGRIPAGKTPGASCIRPSVRDVGSILPPAPQRLVVYIRVSSRSRLVAQGPRTASVRHPTLSQSKHTHETGCVLTT